MVGVVLLGKIGYVAPSMKLLGTLVFLFTLLGLWCGPASARAAEVVPELVINGVTYENVRWGPVHNGKVTFFHNRGAETGVPLTSLPPEWQRRLGQGSLSGATPQAGADSAFQRLQQQQAAQRARAEEARQRALEAKLDRYRVIDGEVVPVSQLTPLVGFLQSRVELDHGEHMERGWLFDLAELPEAKEAIPAEMRMRPGLWQRTGEQVFLRDFEPGPTPSPLLWLHGLAAGEFLQYRAYVVGTKPTPEQVRLLP